MSFFRNILISIFTFVALVGMSFALATPTFAIETPDTCGGKCPLIGDPKGAFGEGTDLRKTISDFILGAARILTFIAVAVAVIYMVWGGYQWMNVNDPDGAKKGQQTVTNSAIGLAVAILAYTIVGLLAGALQGDLTAAFGGGTGTSGGTQTTETPAAPAN
jgi:Type IV secretion system pilin